TEDHHPSLRQVPGRAPRNIGLGHLPHGDRRLNASVNAELFEEILQRQAVHDRAEHAHVIGACSVDAVMLQLGTAEEVATANHDPDLDAAVVDHGNLTGDAFDHVGVDTDGPATEHLTRQLQQDAASRTPAG